MKKILFAAFAALSMIACNKDDATTIIPDIDHPLLALRVRVQRQR